VKILFIINPIAGNGTALRAVPEIEKQCRNLHLDFDIQLTRYPGHGSEIAKEMSNRYSIITAVGGDGTVLEVANGLIGSKVPLGIIPLGSGNDLSRGLGIPSTIDGALSNLMKSRPQSIDIGLIGGNCYFLNVASIGFDAEIVKDLEGIRRWIPGKAAYYFSAFHKLLTYRPKTVKLKMDQQERVEKILLLAICNGSYYGGGMKVNPKGSFTDGYLDLILIRPLSKIKFILLFQKFVKGEHLALPYVEHLKCKELEIKSDEELVINGDGEIIASTPAQLSIRHLAIEVIFPA